MKRDSRIAGLLYLAMVALGPLGILYAPSQALVPGDAAATALALAQHDVLIRLGVMSSVACQVVFIFLALALERVFRGVNETWSRAMVALVIASVPLAIGAELFQLAALQLNASPGNETLVLASLQMHGQGVYLVSFFWGLWLIPFGMLTIRSAQFPRWLGVLLIIGGISYVLDSSLAMLAPAMHDAITDKLLLPLMAGEISMVFWLIVKGPRVTAG